VSELEKLATCLHFLIKENLTGGGIYFSSGIHSNFKTSFSPSSSVCVSLIFFEDFRYWEQNISSHCCRLERGSMCSPDKETGSKANKPGARTLCSIQKYIGEVLPLLLWWSWVMPLCCLQMQTIDTSRQQRRKLPAPPVKGVLRLLCTLSSLSL